VGLNQEFTYAEIISVFGEPLYDVFDSIPEKTEIVYEFGDYKLYLTTSETTSHDQELSGSISFDQITVREK
jgi:hypothetical protein